MAIPFVYASILLTLYTLTCIIGHRKFHKYHIYNGFVYFLVYMGPGILTELLKSVNCRNVGDKMYNAADLTVDC